MHSREIELLDPDLDDAPEPLELARIVGRSANDVERERDDDELGLRCLYEDPEPLLRRRAA